jgi:hypothetical protein
MPGDNIYPDLSNDKFDIQYARLKGLSSDLRASFGVVTEGRLPAFETPSDDDTGLMRFGVAAEDFAAAENRQFDWSGYNFVLGQSGATSNYWKYVDADKKIESYFDDGSSLYNTGRISLASGITKHFWETGNYGDQYGTMEIATSTGVFNSSGFTGLFNSTNAETWFVFTAGDYGEEDDIAVIDFETSRSTNMFTRAHWGNSVTADGFTNAGIYLQTKSSSGGTYKGIFIGLNSDIQFENYPNTRDDGDATRFLTTDSSGNVKLMDVDLSSVANQNLFSSIAVSGQTTVTANSTTTTLNLVAGSNVTITTDNTTKSITINSSAGGSGAVNTGAQYKAAYYPSAGTTVDDWVGVNFGQSNLNTQIVSQATTEVLLELKAITSQSANILNISSSSGTGNLISVDASGNALFAARARFTGLVSGTAASIDRVDIGVEAGTPRMYFEDSGSTIWAIDNSGGIFRWFTPGVVRFDISTASASFATGLTVGLILGGASSLRQFVVIEDNATNNAVTVLQRLTHTTSGTPGVGIGAGMEFMVETSAGNNEIGARIDAVTTNVSSGTEAFDIVFRTMTGGAAVTESLRIKDDGKLQIQSIAQDDAETKIVVWNSTDKILEWRDASTLGGGGGYTNLTQFVAQTAWRVFYSDGSGDVQELAIGASGDVLTSNGTAAAPSWQTPGSGSITADNGLTMSTSTNVQLGGTLLQDTTIDATSAYSLNITGSRTDGQGVLNVFNTSAGTLDHAIYGETAATLGRAVYGNATNNGVGVYGNGQIAGIFGQSSGGYGGNFTSIDGIAIYGLSNMTATNTVVPILQISRGTSGTAANGIGGSLDFFNQMVTTGSVISNQIISKLTDATAASVTSQLIITGVDSATTRDLLRLASAGTSFFTETFVINNSINNAQVLWADMGGAVSNIKIGDVPSSANSTLLQVNDNTRIISVTAGEGFRITPMSAAAASSITPAEGTLVVVNTTNGTFTSVGIWCYENGSWNKL